MALATMAFAQNIDSRARQLMEGMGASEAAGPHRSMDVKFTTVTYMEGDEFETTTRMVVDYEQERAAIISEVMGMETVMVFIDGSLSMKMMGMSIPLPAEMQGEFAGIFDQGDAQSILDSAVSLTFDGPVNYGDLLVGDQVTYVGDAAAYGTPEAPEVHYVFNASGAMLGMHIPADDGEIIMVYSEPMTTMIAHFDASTYILNGGTWQLLSVTTVDYVEFDVEIDESLF